MINAQFKVLENGNYSSGTIIDHDSKKPEDVVIVLKHQFGCRLLSVSVAGVVVYQQSQGGAA